MIYFRSAIYIVQTLGVNVQSSYFGIDLAQSTIIHARNTIIKYHSYRADPPGSSYKYKEVKKTKKNFWVC
jgi:hypothetical protein